MLKSRTVFFVLCLALVACLVHAAERPVYLDPSAPVEKRVEDLLGRMTLEEKAGQMTQLDLGVFKTEGRLDEEKITKIINGYKIGSVLSGGGSTPPVNKPSEWIKTINRLQKAAAETRLGIPILYGIDAVHGHNNLLGATIYPHNLGLAATWNPQLVEEIAEMTARDVSATAIHWNFAPVLDVLRDPRWGRTYETFGEDPYLVGVMGEAAVRGYQKKGNIIACAKHYAGYSGSNNGMDRQPADISERVLREIFLPPFERAVKAGVETVMVNSGEVDGVPAHASHRLLTEILKGEMGFKGIVVTDFQDISRLHTAHKTASSGEEAVYQSVSAGIDMSMVPYDTEFTDMLISLVREKRIPEKRIDDAVRPILAAKFKLGLFERRYLPEDNADKIIGDKKSRDLALQAARQTITLLKNNGVLPLSKNIKNILVSGPCADSMARLCGGWTIGWQGARETDFKGMGLTVSGAIAAKAQGAAKVNTVRWGSMRNAAFQERLKKACDEADVCIAVVGENPYAEGEGDAMDIGLAKDQVQFIKTLAASKKPVVVVLISGRPMILGEILEESAAIIWAYLPGTAGGEAVADVLLGNYNPSGKLPVTIPLRQGQLPIWYNCKVTAKYAPEFEFGYGLSYTSFSYSELKVKEKNKRNSNISISVKVKNTGPVAGDEIVILYVSDVYRSVTPPREEVKGFSRVSLKPGQAKTVKFTLTPDQLHFYDVNMKKTFEPGKYTIRVGTKTSYFYVD